MKVLAKTGGNSFICEVSEVEVKKFMNTYYNRITQLEIGGEVDLAKGYDFASDARASLKKTQEFIESNGEIIKSIIDGVKIFGVVKGDNHEA